MSNTIIKVAINVPLHKVFDYLMPKEMIEPAPEVRLPVESELTPANNLSRAEELELQPRDLHTTSLTQRNKNSSNGSVTSDFSPKTISIEPGMRVLVPFGRTRKVGIVIDTDQSSTLDAKRLKHITKVLDDRPCLDQELLALLVWAANYYRHPLGEVASSALPKKIRDGENLDAHATIYRVTAALPRDALEQLTRAPRQAELLSLLIEQQQGLSTEQLAALPFQSRTPLQALTAKGWVEQHVEKIPIHSPIRKTALESTHVLNDEQQQAVDFLTNNDRFRCTLLHGVTGSGKTEVYFHHIQHVLDQGKQCLVLVPEISLTPQLLHRFERRFDTHVAVMHSALTDTERLLNWRASSAGVAKIIIGTRSAVFIALKNPGLIVIDEEHDGSLKQQEGFRYSARDLAIVRAQRLDIPVVLGTATPSLESLNNVAAGRYSLLELTTRAGGAVPPTIRLIEFAR